MVKQVKVSDKNHQILKSIRDYLRLRTIDDVITILIEIALDREKYYKEKIQDLFNIKKKKVGRES